MHRYVVKNDLIAPILDVLKAEGARDNMLTSACMDVFDMIRSVRPAQTRGTLLTIRSKISSRSSIIYLTSTRRG
jgi:hypothetical protein